MSGSVWPSWLTGAGGLFGSSAPVTALGGMGSADAEQMLGLQPVTSGTLGGMGAADAESMMGLPPVSTTAPGPGVSSGGNLSGLPGALSAAAKAAGGKDDPVAAIKAPVPGAPGKAGTGAAQLGQLIALLQKRNAQYFPSGSSVASQPVPIPRSTGLLGF
jgi:hypothetical protein